MQDEFSYNYYFNPTKLIPNNLSSELDPKWMIDMSWIEMSLFLQETDQNIANSHICQRSHMLQKLNILPETKFCLISRLLGFCTFAIRLIASWSVIIFCNPDGRSQMWPSWWGRRARGEVLRCRGLGCSIVQRVGGCVRWNGKPLGSFFRLHSPCVASGEQSTQTLHLGLVWDDLCSLSFLCHVSSGYWPDVDHYKLAETWRNPSVWTLPHQTCDIFRGLNNWEIL